ncbi:Orotidine 5'-phosphate decarboxylase [Candidatus Gugararchaeum adminiculabundum]|nr:Orotidine 5'-phosphate decarboxylase [Candidatus Gugararchaeum adminiculabundum]
MAKNFADELKANGSRLILSLDVETLEQVKKTLSAVKGSVAAVKLHPELALICGMNHREFVELVKQESGNAPIILDAKLADIDKSNKMKAEFYFSRGYDAIIAHGISGEDAVKAVCDAAKDAERKSGKVKGVFLLASMSSNGNLFDEAKSLRLALMAKKLGVAGVVAPGNNYAATAGIRAMLDEKQVIISPGIGAQGGDASLAIAAGTDFAIVGRSLVEAKDVKKEAGELNKKIKEALGKTRLSWEDFLVDYFVAKGALKFGEFKYKSGRTGPYYFNTGVLSDGEAIAKVANSFARKIVAEGLEDKIDVLFGPAYKGIPMATGIAQALQELGINKRLVYDRKEAKQHGDAADKVFVGELKKGDRVLLIDDVITTGSTKVESIRKIAETGAKVVGVMVVLDRQEKNEAGENPVKEIEKTGARFYSILKVRKMFDTLSERGKVSSQQHEAFRKYQKEFGI